MAFFMCWTLSPIAAISPLSDSIRRVCSAITDRNTSDPVPASRGFSLCVALDVAFFFSSFWNSFQNSLKERLWSLFLSLSSYIFFASCFRSFSSSDMPAICLKYSSSDVSSSSSVVELSDAGGSTLYSSLYLCFRLSLKYRLCAMRSASASKPHVSIDEGIANIATENTAVVITISLVYQGNAPSGTPCPVSIRIAKYMQDGIELNSSASC
mmetsp:Transcript_11071/g.17505  ORF Transcript_11071/g.17505 Transcript_11071/m.17505 type:complete len:211 (+) Transcript_11071:188-820(+)